MKNFLAITLSIFIVFSLFSFPAYAEDPDWGKLAENSFANKTDDEVKLVMLLSIIELTNRGVFEESVLQNVLLAIGVTKDTSPIQTEFSFGQGTFIVGIDLPAGTYDIICEETDDASYSESMNALGDMYSSLGLGEYADVFGALGGLADSTASMHVSITNTKGYTDQFLQLKSGETARIILDEGMKLELTNGHAKLVFIR